MQWPRDEDADEEIPTLIRSAKSLLTVMTRVTVAGMVADPIVEPDTRTTSDVTADIATATLTASVAEIDIAIATGNTTDGAA